MGSADWMPRNFYRRIEVTFPIVDGNLRERIASELLALVLADNARARLLRPDGTYRLATPGRADRLRRSQFEFVALAANGAHRGAKARSAKIQHPQVQLAKRPF